MDTGFGEDHSRKGMTDQHGRAILAREHNGELHRVVVMPDGFAWNGKTYGSLSEVARAITGTNWNGPRFFGLRDRRSQTRACRARSSAG